MVPACSSGTLTYYGAATLTCRATYTGRDILPIPVCRHRADLCCTLMWSTTMEATITHFNVFSLTLPIITSMQEITILMQRY